MAAVIIMKKLKISPPIAQCTHIKKSQQVCFHDPQSETSTCTFRQNHVTFLPPHTHFPLAIALPTVGKLRLLALDFMVLDVGGREPENTPTQVSETGSKTTTGTQAFTAIKGGDIKKAITAQTRLEHTAFATNTPSNDLVLSTIH
jgi:hypothetical protein